MSNERILYPTLTKPILVKGVPRDWAMLTFMVGPATFMLYAQFFEKLWPLFLGAVTTAVLWVIGFMLAKYWDPEFLSVVVQKRLLIRRTTGPGKYTGNKYWG